MSSTSIKIHFILLLILGGMIFLQFRDTEKIQPASYKQVHTVLNEIIRLDAAADTNIMRLHNAQVSNYDQLTADAKQFKRAFALLAQAIPAKQTSLIAPLQALKVSMQLQLDAIDHFRRDFGILLNSRRYISTLISQNIQAHPKLTVPLLRLQNDLLEFSLFPDDGLKQRIKARQPMLKNASLKELSHHSNIILEYTPKVQQQLYAVVHCGTPTNTYQLSDAYEALYTQQVQALESKRTWLFGFVVLFGVYLLFMLYLLMRSGNQLRLVNNNLETIQQRLEKELKARSQSESRYRTLLNSSSAAIMTYANNQFISANPATLQMFGFDTEQEIIGTSAASVSPPYQADRRDSQLAAQAYIETALHDGHCAFEWLHQRKNGEVFPTHVQLTTLTVDHQAVLQAVVTDLTGLKQLEQEKELLANALQHTADAVLITDTDAKILYVNVSFEQLTGHAHAEIIGQFASILRSNKENPATYKRILKTLNQGMVWKGELLTRHKSGEEMIIAQTIAPIFNAAGDITNHVAVMRDVSAEREQAKKWEHTQRLESLGVLAGGIAHDFNNILTAIMGNAALARRSLPATSPANDKIDKIETSSQRAADLCQQMLAYSGKGKFMVQAISLSQLVKEMVHLIEVSIEKNVVIKYHLAENLPLVDVDLAQLQQIVLNLITNANEAIEENSGVISFSTGVMHADAAYLQDSYCDDGIAEGRFVYVEVSDTGCGMTQETIQKIFDPFFTTKFTGRGLGMSAVLGIVRGHHGALRVYSEVGKGTTFKILLPASDATALEEPARSNKTGDDWQANGTILIVDDEETIREVATIMLKDMGFATLTAVDGKDAVEIYQQHHDDISAVLLDMTMPKMDGKACFRELRRINKGVQVILSSGYSEEDATGRFQGKGLAGFIQKPYMPDNLKAMMQQVCGNT